MAEYWGVEWLNMNAQRSYPLSEAASSKDTSAALLLPEDFLVDFVMSVHGADGLDPSKFHLYQLMISDSAIMISFAYDGTLIGSVTIPVSGFQRNSVYTFYGSGDFFDSVGVITIGSLSNLMSKAAGLLEFDLAGGMLEPTTVRPDIRGITSLAVLNGEDLSDTIQGDVIFETGYNFKITATPGNPSTIRFDAIDGAGLNDPCECTEGQELPSPILTINGIGPDEIGNFDLDGSECIQIDPLTHGLKLTDKCSEPCCDCRELEVVTDTLQRLQDNIHSLESFGSRVAGAVEQMNNVIFSSHMGDCDATP